MPQVMGEDGQFHAAGRGGRPVRHASPRAGWRSASSGCSALTVFYQFFTRYVLNDSAAWTEEIARYLLIGMVFVGAAIGVAKNNHIQVDFFYRYMPPARRARGCRTLVDVLRIAFFAAAVVLTVQMMLQAWATSTHDDRRPADEHRLRRRACSASRR